MFRERDDWKEGVFLPDLFGTTPSGLKNSSGLSCTDQSMFSASELLQSVLQTKEIQGLLEMHLLLLFLLICNLKDQPRKHMDCDKFDPNGTGKQYAMKDLCI